MAGGRPTEYRDAFCELATNYCLLGATDVQLAEFFGVSGTTINNWKKEHPDFLASIRAGKEDADAQIAGALFHRARGYSHKETDIRVIDKKIVQTELTKHYPPEVKAIIFWLKNRQKTLWRDIQQLTGAGDEPLIPKPETDMDLARKLAYILSRAAIEKESKS